MQNKRVFIIHGWDGSPKEAWLSWLTNKLKEQGAEVIAPQMPNAEEPEIGEWVRTLVGLVGQADENTYFVGHSIGCQTIMRYLESISPKKVGGAVFVAGWFHLENLEGPEEDEIAKPWIETPIDFGKLKATTNNFFALFSDNDEWVPLADKDIFEKELGAEVAVEKGMGHFTEDDGANELSIVLEKLIEMIK